MKTFFRSANMGLVYTLLVGLLAGCTHEADDVTTDTDCRLLSYSQTNGPKDSQQATYTYDAEGKLLKADTTWTQSCPNGASYCATGKGNYTSTYTYDAEGYLTTQVSQMAARYDHPDGRVETRDQDAKYTFTYTDGKLTGFVYTSFKNSMAFDTQSLATKMVGTFEYDGAGNLLKRKQITTYTYDPAVLRETPFVPSGTEYAVTWNYENNVLVDLIEKIGSKETHSATIQNGLVVRSGTANSYSTMQYDEQNRLTKFEQYNDGLLNSYYTQEWDNVKPASAALPAFKGFPTTNQMVGVGALKKFSYYGDWDGNGTPELMTVLTNTHQSNALEFVTNVASETKYLYGPVQPSTKASAIAYTYDCR